MVRGMESMPFAKQKGRLLCTQANGPRRIHWKMRTTSLKVKNAINPSKNT